MSSSRRAVHSRDLGDGRWNEVQRPKVAQQTVSLPAHHRVRSTGQSTEESPNLAEPGGDRIDVEDVRGVAAGAAVHKHLRHAWPKRTHNSAERNQTMRVRAVRSDLEAGGLRL